MTSLHWQTSLQNRQCYALCMPGKTSKCWLGFTTNLSIWGLHKWNCKYKCTRLAIISCDCATRMLSVFSMFSQNFRSKTWLNFFLKDSHYIIVTHQSEVSVCSYCRMFVHSRFVNAIMFETVQTLLTCARAQKGQSRMHSKSPQQLPSIPCRSLKANLKQECILVGCVPPAHWPYLIEKTTHAPRATMHAPPGSNHACPPRATMHAPPEQPCMAPQEQPRMPPRATMHAPPSNHACPPLWTDRHL